MKKYLSKNIFKIKIILFLISFGISFVFSNALAQSKLEYYEKLFGINYGFSIYDEDKDTSPSKDYTSSDSNKSYLFLLSSSITRERTLVKYFEKNKKIILVCDKSYSTKTPSNFSCDKSTAFSSDMENTAGFLKRIDSQGVDLYVIPENLLASPDERSNIAEYFKAFKRSDTAPSISEDTDVTAEVIRKIDQIKALLKTSTFETFGIAMSMFLVVSVFFGLLKYLTFNNKKKFHLSLLKKNLLKIKEYFILHRWFMIYEIIVLTLMYIPIIITLGVKDGMGINFGYFINYSLDTFKVTNLVVYIDQGNYFRVVIFFYNFIYLITLSVLIVPSVVTTLLVASSKIVNAKLKTDVQKYVVPSLIVLSIIGSSFFKISESYRFLIFTSVVLAFIIFNNLRFKTFDHKYSYHEKMMFISFAFVVFIFGFLLKVRESRTGPSYKEEDLIGVTDDVVTLPYSKQMGDYVLFNDFEVSILNPIFVDKYLVYSPTYSRVENKNALEFKNSESYYIQNGVVEDMVLAIYTNEKLSNAMVSKFPTNFFKIKGLEPNSSQSSAKIQITFSCESEDIGINEIRSNYYYLSSENEVKESEEKLLYFPGCSKVGEPETFTVEFKPPYIESDSFFMRLIDVLGKDIKDIKIIVLDMVIQPIYYSKGKGYTVIASSGLTNSARTKIINYIFSKPYNSFEDTNNLSEDFYNLSFDMELDQEGKFNISKPINELVKQGVLKDSFLIWSTKKYVPIRVGL